MADALVAVTWHLRMDAAWVDSLTSWPV